MFQTNSSFYAVGICRRVYVLLNNEFYKLISLSLDRRLCKYKLRINPCPTGKAVQDSTEAVCGGACKSMY